MRHVVLGAAGLILVASGAAVLAAKKPSIASQWRDREIAIDGDSGDWPGPLKPIEENHPLMAAAMNDGQFLYLVLSTSDSTERRQILRQGLIVWFDPSGGEKKHFGVKYPVGVPPEERPSRSTGGYRRGGGSGGGHSAGDPNSGDPSRPASPDQVEPTNRLEVYGPQKDDAHSFVTEMAPGITVKTGSADGYLVYELKVPLTKTADFPYAIETKPGASIGIGVETPKMERPAGEGHEGGRGGGFGGFGGGMGGRGGGGGMGRGGGGGEHGEQPKPLKNWATIQLAAKGAASVQLPGPGEFAVSSFR